MKSPSTTQSKIFQHLIALHVSSNQKHGVDLFAIRQNIDFNQKFFHHLIKPRK